VPKPFSPVWAFLEGASKLIVPRDKFKVKWDITKGKI
jgi:hypothetical protein